MIASSVFSVFFLVFLLLQFPTTAALSVSWVRQPRCFQRRRSWELLQRCVVRESLALVNCSRQGDDELFHRKPKKVYATRGQPLCSFDGQSASISRETWKWLMLLGRVGGPREFELVYWCFDSCPRRGILRFVSHKELPRLRIEFRRNDPCVSQGHAKLLFWVHHVNSSNIKRWWVTKGGEEIFSHPGNCRGCHVRLRVHEDIREGDEKSYALYAIAKIKDTGLRVQLSESHALGIEAVGHSSTACSTPLAAQVVTATASATAYASLAQTPATGALAANTMAIVAPSSTGKPLVAEPTTTDSLAATEVSRNTTYFRYDGFFQRLHSDGKKLFADHLSLLCFLAPYAIARRR